MKAIYEHQRGNHSREQVQAHGKLLFIGTNKEAAAILAKMRRQSKARWQEASTNVTVSEWVEYEMSEIFVYDAPEATTADKVNNTWL